MVQLTPDVLLGGDCCHDQALYTHPCRHDIASFGTHLGETVTLHENHEEAKANFQRPYLMSLRENVMVILAHERQALGVLPMLNKAGENRGVLSRWSTEGWKEAKLSKARA